MLCRKCILFLLAGVSANIRVLMTYDMLTYISCLWSAYVELNVIFLVFEINYIPCQILLVFWIVTSIIVEPWLSYRYVVLLILFK